MNVAIGFIIVAIVAIATYAITKYAVGPPINHLRYVYDGGNWKAFWNLSYNGSRYWINYSANTSAEACFATIQNNHTSVTYDSSGVLPAPWPKNALYGAILNLTAPWNVCKKG